MMGGPGVLEQVHKRATPEGERSPEPQSTLLKSVDSEISTPRRSESQLSDNGISTAVFFLSNGRAISTIARLTNPYDLISDAGTDNPSQSFTAVLPSTSSSSSSSTTTISSASLPSSSTAAPSGTLESASQETVAVSTEPTTRNSNEKGLIAGIAVLAILLAVAIGAIVFLLFRKRRSATAIDEANKEHPITISPQLKTSREPSVSSLETSIAQLERQLHAKDSELRNTKAALLASGKRTSTLTLSDHQIGIRFARLTDAIGDWVHRCFDRFEPISSPPADVLGLLQRISVSYDTLLQNHDTQQLVIRAVVADIIAQAFVTDQFFGDPTFTELKHSISAKACATDVNEWRALTVRMLSKSESFQVDRSTTIEDVTQKIYRIVSSLAQRKKTKQRLADLRDIVEWASNLALDLAIQRALIKVERPDAGLGTFVPDTMTEINQDMEFDEKDLELEGADKRQSRGKPVKLCVFPAVVRRGDERGIGYEREHLVCKAQVLL